MGFNGNEIEPETIIAFSVLIPLFVCSCCVIYCCWIYKATGKCQRGREGPTQTPPTSSQTSYHTSQQQYIAQQHPSIQSQPYHIVLDNLPPPQYTTITQITIPGDYKKENDAPPPYSQFQDEAPDVLGQNK